MSTPANTFDDMMRAAEDMGMVTQQSFGPSHASQADLSWPILLREWMEMLFGNAIVKTGLGAKTALIASLNGITPQVLINDKAFSQTIRHPKTAEVSDQAETETIVFICISAGAPSKTKAITLAGAVLFPNKEKIYELC